MNSKLCVYKYDSIVLRGSKINGLYDFKGSTTIGMSNTASKHHMSITQ